MPYEPQLPARGNNEPVMEGIRWKFVAALSVIAMAVSLLSGGLAGIRFGTLLVRAFVGGVLFAVLSVGLNFFIVRFFPELFEDDTAFGTESDEAGPGGRIDIVMPAEMPGASSAGSEDSGLEAFPGAEAGIVGEGPDGGGGREPMERRDSADDGETVVGDLDRFSADFTDDGDDMKGSHRSMPNVPGGDREPQEIAQAIQTVMKRDKKG